jgi:hypothetical protein
MEMLMPRGEDALRTGAGGEVAAEAPLPTSRRRRGTQQLAIVATLGAGLAMLAVALLSGGDAWSVGLTAAAGTFVAGVGAAAIAEVMPKRRVGAVALITGLACIASAIVPDVLAGPELVRLLAGAALIVAAAALLPREPDVAPAVRL